VARCANSRSSGVPDARSCHFDCRRCAAGSLCIVILISANQFSQIVASPCFGSHAFDAAGRPLKSRSPIRRLLNRELIPLRTCALSPVSPSTEKVASTDLSEELPQNGDVPMSPLFSIGGLGAIGGHNSNLKIDLSFAGAVGTSDWHVRNPDCVRT
jgi:hypothetical protein